MKNKNELAVALSVLSVHTDSIMSSFTYTAKESGEVSKVVVDHGCNLTDLYRDDLVTLSNLRKISTDPVEIEVIGELTESLTDSLEMGLGNNPRYTHKDIPFIYFNDKFGNRINGIKMNPATFEVLIRGVVIFKEVLTEGVHKTVNSKPKTIVKNKIRKMLKTSKIRTYLLPNTENLCINGVRVNGDKTSEKVA